MEEAAMTRWVDQQRMEPVRAANARLLVRVQEEVGPVAHRLTDQFFQAIDFQLMADYRYREAERVETLGLENERAQAARRAADRYNTTSLDVLTEDFPSAIDEVRQQFGDQDIDVRFRDSLASFEQEGREQLADMDLTAEQAAVAGNTLSETTAAANEFGINGLCDRLQDQASQFAELRRRRPEHNDPAATITGAILCGIGATILAICWAASGPGPCTDPVAIGLAIFFFAAGGMILLAELGKLIYALVAA
jgi:hypothetical protein